VGKVALPHLPVSLLPALALVSVQKENKLLLDEFALLGISRVGSRAHPLGYWRHKAWLLDLRGLLLAHVGHSSTRNCFFVHCKWR